MKFQTKTEITKPKIRELEKYISPNPKTINKMILFKETSTCDLKNIESEFENWEKDDLICALIIDTQDSPPLRNEDYLIKVKKALTCPIIRLNNIKEQDEIFDAKILGFDAQITSPEYFTADKFFNLDKLAQNQNLLLIPSATKKDHWQKIAALHKKFIYIDEGVGKDLPLMIKESGKWLIANAKLKEQHNLKCIIQEHTI